MRPIKLKFKGIGSYFAETEIDFTALDSVFLICGDTGSGKSTILDAIMLALYGESSGGERNELRNCHYTKADGAAYSCFEFSVGKNRYRFTRGYSPKPKAEGYDPIRNCEYFDVSQNMWLPFFDNPTEDLVNKKAGEILGLDSKQFRQVIILPQGRFEKLLTGSTKEKEPVLKPLFGSSKFSAVAETLKAQADENAAAVKQERFALETELKANGFENLEEAKLKAQELSYRAKQLEKELEAALTEKEAASKETAQAAVLSERFTALGSAEKKLEELCLQKPRRDKDKALIISLEKQKDLLPSYENFILSKEELKERCQNSQKADRELEKAAKDLENALTLKNKQETAAKETESMKEELIRLNSLAPLYEKTEPLKSKLRSILNEGTALRSKKQAAEQSLENLKKTLSESCAKAENMQKNSSDRLPDLYEKQSILRNARKLSQQLKTVNTQICEYEKKLEKLDIRLSETEKKESDAKKNYDIQKQLFMNSVCSRLAQQLADNSPCPVCGSLHHPAKFSGKAESVSDIDKASEALRLASEEKGTLISEINSHKKMISDLKKQSEELALEIASSGYTDELYEKTEALCREAKAESERLAVLRENIKILEEEKTAAQTDFDKISSEHADARAAYLETKAALDTFAQQADPDIPDLSSLESRTKALSEEIFSREQQYKNISERFLSCEKAGSAAEIAKKIAAEEETNARRKQDTAEQNYKKALAENGFEPNVSFVPDKEAISRTEALKADYDSFVQELSAAKKSAEEIRSELSGKERPDLEKVREKLACADKKYSDLDLAKRQTQAEAEKTSALAESAEKKAAELEQKTEVCLRRSEFASLMSGAKGISFARYVLGVMLDMVIEETNRSLSDMLGGAFRLERSRSIKENSKQGLDISVCNTLRDSTKSYPSSQLSGGEKFLISLALGMALSSVVQKSFGGISIDAMFIDEGFGSLDPQTLSDAIKMISSIKGSRRTVGVISHVDRLKEEIPCCINVKKTEKGSILSVT